MQINIEKSVNNKFGLGSVISFCDQYNGGETATYLIVSNGHCIGALHLENMSLDFLHNVSDEEFFEILLKEVAYTEYHIFSPNEVTLNLKVT